MNSETFWNIVGQPATEWVVLSLNLVFLILIIRENIWCWLFGIFASAISVVMFIDPSVALYSEALLYSVYVILGAYAWFNWYRNGEVKSKSMPVIQISFSQHLVYITIGGLTWFGLGYFFNTYTDSKLPWADAFSTGFAFVATYLEAKKVLETWFYWIILNLFSVWLYHARDREIMAGMMVIFFVFSIVGYLSWKKSQKNASLEIEPEPIDRL